MKKVTDDLIGLTYFNTISIETVMDWRNDILYMMKKRALKEFEIQFSKGSPKGYRYTVSSSGYIYANDKSGGIDYYLYPSDVNIKMFYKLDESSPNYDEVFNELTKNRGVGTNGKSLKGNYDRDKTYSKDNYGVIRERII
jgi:hypothetical protein